jgi:hypothetical protein
MSGFVMSEEGRPQIVIGEDFRVDTPEQAAWAMRKYRVLAQRKARTTGMAKAERDRIDAWEQRVNAGVEAQMEWLAGHLEVFAMRERLAGRKTVDLPDGVIKTRQSGPSFEVDKSVFVEWALESKRDDVLRVSYAPDMAGIKSAFVADSGLAIDPVSSEVVPGLLPVPERVSIVIDPDLEAIDLEGFDDGDE